VNDYCGSGVYIAAVENACLISYSITSSASCWRCNGTESSMQQQINVILPVVGAEYVCCVILKKMPFEMWAELIGLPEHLRPETFRG
jgi:hypothetical protein